MASTWLGDLQEIPALGNRKRQEHATFVNVQSSEGVARIDHDFQAHMHTYTCAHTNKIPHPPKKAWKLSGVTTQRKTVANYSCVNQLLKRCWGFWPRYELLWWLRRWCGFKHSLVDCFFPLECLYESFRKKRAFKISIAILEVVINVLLVCSLYRSRYTINGWQVPIQHSSCLTGYMDCPVCILR